MSAQSSEPTRRVSGLGLREGGGGGRGTVAVGVGKGAVMMKTMKTIKLMVQGEAHVASDCIIGTPAVASIEQLPLHGGLGKHTNVQLKA